MYSYSKIKSYFNCPLMFRYRYVDKVKVERFESIEGFMGTRVHEVLFKLYKDKMHEKENSLDDAVGFYEQIWERKFSDAVQVIKKQYTAQNYRDMGRKYVEDYYRKNMPFACGRVLGLEEKVIFKIGGHGIIGYIDRLSLNKDKGYEIHDYKTSANMPRQDYFDRDEQLALYALAVKKRYDDARNVRLVWHYLAFNKEIASVRTDEELDKTRDSVIRKIEIIEDAVKENQFIPNGSKLCLWCEYQKICPLHKHRFSSLNAPMKDEDVGHEVGDAGLKDNKKDDGFKIEGQQRMLGDYCKNN